MVSGEKFEDITVCINTPSLPRVDFCGLNFDRNTIGVKFWFLNRTGVELKFWLMDISINEIYCGSTELVGTVDDDKNVLYTYELSLPEEVGYYSVNKIEFYVEIDKPGNETIYDTNVVEVRCDTIKRIFCIVFETTT